MDGDEVGDHEETFNTKLNPENYQKLLETGSKHLEEVNYWGDTFWGVHKNDSSEPGVGENNLGRLLMEIRESRKA